MNLFVGKTLTLDLVNDQGKTKTLLVWYAIVVGG